MLVLGPTNQRPVMFPWWTDDRTHAFTLRRSPGSADGLHPGDHSFSHCSQHPSTQSNPFKNVWLVFSSLYQRFVWAAFGWFWFHRVDGNMFPTGWSHVTIGNNEIDVSSIVTWAASVLLIHPVIQCQYHGQKHEDTPQHICRLNWASLGKLNAEQFFTRAQIVFPNGPVSHSPL